MLGLTPGPVVSGTVPELPPTVPVPAQAGLCVRAACHERGRGSAARPHGGGRGGTGDLGTLLGTQPVQAPLRRLFRADPGAGTPTWHRGRQDERRGSGTTRGRPAPEPRRRSVPAPAPHRADYGTAPSWGWSAPWGRSAPWEAERPAPDQARLSPAPTRNRHPAPPYPPPRTRHPAPRTPHPAPRTHAEASNQATNIATEVTTRHHPRTGTPHPHRTAAPPQPTPDAPPQPPHPPANSSRPHGANQPPSSRR